MRYSSSCSHTILLLLLHVQKMLISICFAACFATSIANSSTSSSNNCSTSIFPVDLGRKQCPGLVRPAVGANVSSEACLKACCAKIGCVTWQWGDPKVHAYLGCWIGTATKCYPSQLPWVGGTKTAVPSPKPLPSPSPPGPSAGRIPELLRHFSRHLQLWQRYLVQQKAAPEGHHPLP